MVEIPGLLLVVYLPQWHTYIHIVHRYIYQKYTNINTNTHTNKDTDTHTHTHTHSKISINIEDESVRKHLWGNQKACSVYSETQNKTFCHCCFPSHSHLSQSPFTKRSFHIKSNTVLFFFHYFVNWYLKFTSNPHLQ